MFEWRWYLKSMVEENVFREDLELLKHCWLDRINKISASRKSIEYLPIIIIIITLNKKVIIEMFNALV